MVAMNRAGQYPKYVTSSHKSILKTINTPKELGQEHEWNLLNKIYK